MHEALLRRHQRVAQLFASCDVAPRTDDLDRLAGRVAQHLEIVAHPAVAPVLLAKAIFAGEALLLEQPRIGPQDAWAVLRVDPALPEVRRVEVVGAVIAEQLRNILTDEGRSKIARGPEAVD